MGDPRKTLRDDLPGLHLPADLLVRYLLTQVIYVLLAFGLLGVIGWILRQ